MDLEDIKRILKKDKGKIIIVDGGRPVMIILPYEEQGSEENFEQEPGPYPEEEVDSEVGELTIDDLPL